MAEYDIEHIVHLLSEWGLQLEQHPTKSAEGGWFATHDGRSVQFNKFGVMMVEDFSITFDDEYFKDRWFAGVIYAECVV